MTSGEIGVGNSTPVFTDKDIALAEFYGRAYFEDPEDCSPSLSRMESGQPAVLEDETINAGVASVEPRITAVANAAFFAAWRAEMSSQGNNGPEFARAYDIEDGSVVIVGTSGIGEVMAADRVEVHEAVGGAAIARAAKEGGLAAANNYQSRGDELFSVGT